MSGPLVVSSEIQHLLLLAVYCHYKTRPATPCFSYRAAKKVFLMKSKWYIHKLDSVVVSVFKIFCRPFNMLKFWQAFGLVVTLPVLVFGTQPLLLWSFPRFLYFAVIFFLLSSVHLTMIWLVLLCLKGSSIYTTPIWWNSLSSLSLIS